MAGTEDDVARSARGASVAALAIAVALLWACWPALRVMAERWSADPRYAHGYLVPAFSAYLAWHRREMAPSAWSPSWWGLVPLLVGAAMQLAGGYIFFGWLEAAAVVLMTSGAILVIGGWPAWRWAWPSVAFLAFMLPLPYRLETAMAGPLQTVATKASTFLLQTVGLTAVSDGNVIYMDGGPIEVVEACGGLGMLFTFVAMSAGAAILIRRPLLDRAIVLASAVPIALAANVARITGTGVMHELVSSKAAGVLFHDLAGWLMMPLALGLMAAELALLGRLLVPVSLPATATVAVVDAGAPGRRGGKAKRGSAATRDASATTEEAIKRALRAR